MTALLQSLIGSKVKIQLGNETDGEYIPDGTVVIVGTYKSYPEAPADDRALGVLQGSDGMTYVVANIKDPSQPGRVSWEKLWSSDAFALSSRMAPIVCLEAGLTLDKVTAKAKEAGSLAVSAWVSR